MRNKNQGTHINNSIAPIKHEELVRDNISWMLALAERIYGDSAIAEDIVQEAFIAAFRGLPNFENRSSLKTWLHRITVNSALTKLRKHKRLQEQSIDAYLPEFDQGNCRIEPTWPKLVSIESIIENEQLKLIVHDKVMMLPDTFRIVLQLREIEGYSTAEVAELLEISISNTKTRLHRARAALKKLLEPILRGDIS